MSNERSAAMLLRFTLLLVVFVVGGLLGTALVGPGPARAAHPCQQVECEGWWIFRDCEENSGGGTYCDGTGRKCKTRACGHP